jgi:glutamine synthetase
MWSFDGSSTEQADGSDSDCLLKPVAVFPDPDRKNSYLVMTEVLNADRTPHESNGRATIGCTTPCARIESARFSSES